jgi:hypothetical protein
MTLEKFGSIDPATTLDLKSPVEKALHILREMQVHHDS